MNITINTDTPKLHSILSWETPEGMKVASSPPLREQKNFNFNIDASINIDLVIDVFKISALVASTWLSKNLISQRGNHKININGKQITIDQAKIE
jgi:hypothetical protein